MSTALKDLAEKNANVAHLFRGILDEELGPMRTELQAYKDNPNLSGEAKLIIERMQTDLTETRTALKALQTAINRPGGIGFDDPKTKSEQRKAAFNRALKLGSYARLSPEEQKLVQTDMDAGIQPGQTIGHGQDMEYKTLFAADGTTGGFLAVPEYVNELIKAIVLVSPMMDIVDVRNTSNPYIMIPKRTTTASATRIAEQATRTETTNPKFGLVQVFPYEAFALTLISLTDMDDASLDLGQFIMDEFAEQFAKLAGNEFINGTGAGSGQALGFLKDTTITNTPTITAVSGAIDYTSLVTLKNSLKTGYRQGASWLMTTETLGVLQGLTDSQNRPLWAPFGGIVPDKLFGYPYIEMPDMPQVATSAFAISFGNFKRGYQAVVRKQVSIQVLKERYIDQNAYGYMGWYRFGGQPKLSEAIKVLQIHS